MICSFDNQPNFLEKSMKLQYNDQSLQNQRSLDFPHSILRRDPSLGTDASFQRRKMGFK
jgi:hypothetical protein